MRPARRPLVLALLALAAAVLVVDQLSKLWAVASLTEGERTPLLGDLLGLTLLYNPGAALSIATGMTWVLTLAAGAVSVVILRIANRLGSRGWAVALGLLLGGALGNLCDRIFREPGVGRGHVVDFIAYGSVFVGNVADIAIVAAAVLIVLLSLRGIGVDGTRAVDGDAEEASGEAATPGSTAPDDRAPDAAPDDAAPDDAAPDDRSPDEVVPAGTGLDADATAAPGAAGRGARATEDA
ncbi:signal peptidase II [Actinotalea subterranea]|uniref:signal peptidase II n=1 Tax=Actinotalea subterranea TaxID=2607497 RepID=UPI001CAA81CE|nr:signal peptidase II [Actinotalea subterranea]